MAFPSTNDTFSNPQGTTLVATDDHAAQHRTEGSAIVALENKMGLSAGTPVANKILVGSGNGTSTWSQTWNNGTLGTPTITGGNITGITFNNLTIGTSQITGGTVASALIGTSQITGGTLTNVSFGGTINSPVFSGQVDGWIQETSSWVYSSATQFKILNIRLDGSFPKGTRIKFTQSATVKFFVCHQVNFSGSDTIVDIIPNADYTLANSAITSPAYSYQLCPTAFPFSFNYTPVITGYSVNPAGGVYRYSSLGGNVLNVLIREPANGTSNATNITYTAPVVSSGFTNAVWVSSCEVVDNGTATDGQMSIPNNNIITIYKNTEGAFTASGAKRVVSGQLMYEF